MGLPIPSSPAFPMKNNNQSIERKRQFALQNFNENEKGFKRYWNLITKGMPEDTARALVKEAFGWTDRRLDKVLDTRAGVFSPATAAEVEAKAMIYLQRLDLDIQAGRRHCDSQLDVLETARMNGDDWAAIEIIDVAGGRNEGTKTKKTPIVEAERKLLEAKMAYNQKLYDALKALRVDTIININAKDISQYTPEELDTLYADAIKQTSPRETTFEEVSSEGSLGEDSSG